MTLSFRNFLETVAGTLAPFGLTYDKLYRLTAVNIINPPTVPPTPPTPIEVFTYDETGNRLSKKLGTAPLVNYNYVPSTHKLANAGTGARNFDANGNSTLIPGTGTISYDERNRLKTVVGTSTTRSASYNARGERVATGAAPLGGGSVEGSTTAKSIGGGCLGNFSESLFIYSESGALLGNYDMCAPSDEDVVYLDSTPIARVKNGVVYPLEADHLGSPRVMQNAMGSSAVWTWNLLSNSTTGSNAFGEQAPTGTQPFNLRFPGQYADGNGLSYNYFRDYEAGTGRYVESDPIGLDGGISTFGYVGGRPISDIDFYGLSSSASCCQSILAQMASNVLATVGCCPQKTVCVNPATCSASGFGPIKCGCAGEHELRHFQDVNCPCDSGQCSGPDCAARFKTKSGQARGECSASKVEISCIRRRKNECNGDIQCRMDADKRVRHLTGFGNEFFSLCIIPK